MPVPKNKRDLFGKIVGRLVKSGLSFEEAKKKADRAIKKGKSGKK